MDCLYTIMNIYDFCMFTEFYCARCALTFQTKKKLLDHRRSEHVSLKCFDCSHCTKKYTRKEHLQTHLRSHTSELHIFCQYCGQQFWQTNHLKSHYTIHKINEVNGECACSICGEFYEIVLLKKHME